MNYYMAYFTMTADSSQVGDGVLPVSHDHEGLPTFTDHLTWNALISEWCEKVLSGAKVSTVIANLMEIAPLSDEEQGRLAALVTPHP